MSFCLSVCASVDIWAANIRSHFRFQLSVQKKWIPSPQLRIILEKGLSELPLPLHASRYMIYFISFNVLTQGAGMGCECCCHCFIRHVKTSSHRNKLLSQHPGLITPRHSSPGEQGERGVLFIDFPNFSINIHNIWRRHLNWLVVLRIFANQTAWPTSDVRNPFKVQVFFSALVSTSFNKRKGLLCPWRLL